MESQKDPIRQRIESMLERQVRNEKYLLGRIERDKQNNDFASAIVAKEALSNTRGFISDLTQALR